MADWRGAKRGAEYAGAGIFIFDKLRAARQTRYLRRVHPFFFFFTLVTGPRRSLSLKLSDTRVYEPQIRARLRRVHPQTIRCQP